MKNTDNNTPILPGDDDIDDPANQEDYPENIGEDTGSSGAGDELDQEDTDDEEDNLAKISMRMVAAAIVQRTMLTATAVIPTIKTPLTPAPKAIR